MEERTLQGSLIIEISILKTHIHLAKLQSKIFPVNLSIP